ncbi:MAG: DNA primase [Nitrospirae bacterium]|nr:MAG: DNA primase [Nitrospirota bacterium]
MELSEFVEELKTKVDIVDVVSEYVELKRAGSQFKALCPFHPEKTPSFFVNPQRQFFHCFGCGVGGDVISFVMKYEGLEFMEALEVLSKKAGLSMEGLRASKGAKGLKERVLEINAIAMRFFRDALKKSEEPKEYLKKRGLSSEAIEVFSIGFAPSGGDILYKHLKNKGHKDEDILRAGLVKRTSEGRLIDMFRHRVIFPIFNTKAEVVGFGGRVLSSEQLGPKYLNSPETPVFKKSRELFGLYQAKEGIKDKGYVILTEGYLDVISAYQAGIKNVVAPLGTALTEEHAHIIKRYTEKVLLLFDSDEAGVNASKRASLLLIQEGLQPKVLLLPAGEDLDSFIKNKGPEALRKLFPRSLPVVDFFISLKGDKLQNIRTLTEAIGRVKDPILKGAILQELSEKTKIPHELLMEQIRKRSGLEKKNVPSHKLKLPTAEELIVALFISYPVLRQKIKMALSEEMFSEPGLRTIFEKVSSSEGAPIQEVLTEEELKRVSSILVRTQIDDGQLEKNLSDSIKKIRAEDIKRQIAQLKKAILKAEKEQPEKVKEYQLKLQSLMREARDEGLL